MNQANLVLALKPVVDLFESLNIVYYIGGSVASSAYGMGRTTMDVDLVADVQTHHVPVLIEHLNQAYYIDENMILNAIAWQSSFNLLHLETFLKIDVFILKNEPYHQITLQRKRQDILDAELPEAKFYFLSVEDIILSKLEWYRMGNEVSERQWKDILGVIKVQQKNLDIGYLDEWATKLQLTTLFRRAFDEANIT
jgi:hypothetical protein